MADGRFVTHGGVTKHEIPGVGLVEFKYCCHCNCLTEAPRSADVEAWWHEHMHQDDLTQLAAYWLDMYVAYLVDESEPYDDRAGRIDYELRPFLAEAGLTDRMEAWSPEALAHFARALAAHQAHIGREDFDNVLWGLREVYEFTRWIQAQGYDFPGLNPFAGLRDVSPEYLPVDVETWRGWIRAIAGSADDYARHVFANLPRAVSLRRAPRVARAGASPTYRQSRAACAVCSQLPDVSLMEFGAPPTDGSIPF